MPRGAGCKRSLAPAGLLLPSPAPSLPPAGHCLRAPRSPPARPRRPSPPTSPDPKFWRRGKLPGERAGWRRLRTRGVPSVFLKSSLPAAATAAAAAAPAAESLGLQPGGSQVSRKTESAGRAPGKGWGWGGAYLAGSPGARACVWLALSGQSGVLYGKVEREELAEPLCLRFTVHCSTYSTCSQERLKTLILYKAACHWPAP